MLMVWLLLLLLSWRRVDARCSKTKSGQGYPLTIGLLTASDKDLRRHKPIQQGMSLTGEVAECFMSPHYLTLLINNTLRIPEQGWTWIKTGIHNALVSQAAVDGVLPNLIIGPFYTNLAMMLQRMDIPYLVTDFKGFDWIDMNRVQDTVNWKTVVEIRPSAQAQNLAVVDLFLYRNWKSAMMVMPESAADNQECQDLAGQMLNRSLSVIPYTVDPRGENFLYSLQELLKNAKLYRQTQMIVCSPRDARDNLTESILTQARYFGILQDPEFSFVLVDPSSALLPLSGPGNMFRLGLFSARCELLAFRYVIPSNEDAIASDVKDAAASDAAAVTSYALSRYISSQTTITDEFSPQRFLVALRSVKLPLGRTGPIEFDEIGQRTNYKLYLYNHGGEDMYKMLAQWNPNFPTTEERLNITATGSQSKTLNQMGIFPELVKIVVVEERPFVMNSSAEWGTDVYEGFTIDLIKRLAEELKFNYEIYRSPMNRYGARDLNNVWDGMVAEIIAGNATLAFGAISITSGREAVIDFSLGVLNTGVNLLVKKPKVKYNIFQFMLPFSLELWMAILGASATVSLVFYILDHCSEDRRFTVKETIWFTIATLLKRGSDFAPVPISQRILTCGFLFFVLIIVSTYTANMAAFLTTKNIEKTIDSFESLSKSANMKVSTVKNSATMTFLISSSDPLFRRLWQKARTGLVENAVQGQSLVKKGQHAFIFDYLINEAAQNLDCEVMTVASPILLQEHGIGMKAGAPFKSAINIALLKLKEEGFISKLKKKWWDDKRQCDVESDTQRTGQVQFGLDHTAGVFIAGVFGVCVAAFLFIGKKTYFLIVVACQKRNKLRATKRRMEQSSHENTILDEGKKERKLFEGDKGEAV